MKYELTEYQRQLVWAAISQMEDFLTDEMNSPEAKAEFRPGREEEIRKIKELYPIFRRQVTVPCKHCGNALYMGQDSWSCFSCDIITSFEELPRND